MTNYNHNSKEITVIKLFATMLPHYFKKAGYFMIALLHIGLFLSFKNVIPSGPLNEEFAAGAAAGWILLSGLIIIAFSKEKEENREVELLRFRSFFKAFFAALLGIVIGSLSNSLLPGKEWDAGSALTCLEDNSALKISVLTMALHQLFFRSALKKNRAF